jgi:conjugal transfer pilus assembly protein TraK
LKKSNNKKRRGGEMKEKMRKKFLIFGGIISSIFLITNVWAGSYVVITPAKVFQKPSVESPTVSYLTTGTEVEEIQKSASGKWIKIKAYNGKVVGWVSLSKLKPKEKSEELCKINLDNTTNVGNKTNGIQPLGITPLGAGLIPSGVISNVGGISKGEIKKEEKGEETNVVYVKPNRTTMIEMSSLDINRVYCDGDITDVIFSEEKGVRVKIVKNNAFVKFAVKKIEDREIPIENPVDLFFICNDQVYNVIALPKRIPSVFIYLESKDKKKIQEVVERAKDLPYEKRLLDIIKAIYINKYEPNYQVVKVNKEFYLFKDIKVVLEKMIDIEGEGLRAKVFSLATQFDSNTQYVEIKEKDFVRKELTTIPLAISLDKTRLQGKDKATLIILEKRIVGE